MGGGRGATERRGEERRRHRTAPHRTAPHRTAPHHVIVGGRVRRLEPDAAGGEGQNPLLPDRNDAR